MQELSLTAIPLTDDRGKPLLRDTPEPEPASVVLEYGEFGTAWQRQFKSGRWHSVRGNRDCDWASLLRLRNLVLVYDAPVRDEGGQ